MAKRSLKQSEGFTLIEILVVITIIVIVSAASIPAGLNFVRHYKVTGAMQNVAAQMQMSRGQAVKRNTNRGILLNFNYPRAGMYQFTSLDPSPVTGAWDGGVYPTYAPLSYTENMANFGAVPVPPNNTADPDVAMGVMSPHGIPVALPIDVQFDAGAFNALLFRADGSVRAVNAARRRRRGDHRRWAGLPDRASRQKHTDQQNPHDQPKRPSVDRELMARQEKP